MGAAPHTCARCGAAHGASGGRLHAGSRRCAAERDDRQAVAQGKATVTDLWAGSALPGVLTRTGWRRGLTGIGGRVRAVLWAPAWASRLDVGRTSIIRPSEVRRRIILALAADPQRRAAWQAAASLGAEEQFLSHLSAEIAQRSTP